jgi:hypothetical protein
MGTIDTQNVTQHATKASNYRLLYISAGDVGFDFIVQRIDAQRPPEISNAGTRRRLGKTQNIFDGPRSV